jgi:hypothetical protein
MKNILIGIVMGIALILTVRNVQGGNVTTVNENPPVYKFNDGNTSCYVFKETVWSLGEWRTIGGISCVRIK